MMRASRPHDSAMKTPLSSRSARAAVAFFALLAFAAHADAQGLPLDKVKLPPGFEIRIFTDNVPNARSMALGPSGVLFVGTRTDRVYAVRYQGDKATRITTIASGLNMPNGVAFRDGALFVAEIGRILRFDDIGGKLDAPPRPAVVTDR